MAPKPPRCLPLEAIGAVFGMVQGFEAESSRLTQAPYPNTVRREWMGSLSFTTTPWSMAMIAWMSGAVLDFTAPYQATFVNALL